MDSQVRLFEIKKQNKNINLKRYKQYKDNTQNHFVEKTMSHI